MGEAPLKGIRVIDLSQYAPGPYTTRLLADLGAQVVKIEPPSGDPMRRMFCQSDEDSPVYQSLNRGKHVIRVDLKLPDKQALVSTLLNKADVLLESFRPGVAARLGFDPDQCRADNPDLIFASLSGYGQTGPYANHAGHDVNYAAAAGMLTTAKPAQPIFPLIADHTGAMNACMSILAALVSRANTGKGMYLDLSLYDAMLGWQYMNESVRQNDSNQLSLLTGGAACYQIYQTSDGRQLTLGALEHHFWKNFCRALHRDDLVVRQKDELPQKELIAIVHEELSVLTLQQVLKQFEGVDCCLEVIPLPEEVYSHPQTIHRNLFSHHKSSFPAMFNGFAIRNDSALKVHQIDQVGSWESLNS